MARLLDEELPATGRFWTEHCVACFVAGEDFEHVKITCDRRTDMFVKEYRGQRMNNQIGKGLCYWCFMPMVHCAK